MQSSHGYRRSKTRGFLFVAITITCLLASVSSTFNKKYYILCILSKVLCKNEEKVEMVRNYIKKKEKNYSKEKLLQALELVKSKTLNSYEAAKQFDIPRSTIISHLYGTRGQKQVNSGMKTVFSIDIEQKLASYLHTLEKYGFPLTKKEVKGLVSEYVVRNGWITPFKNNIPGDDWFRRFCKRNNLSLKKPQSVEIARRKACNPFTVYEYFDLLENAINELDLIEKPEHIYNLDETSFCNDPSKSKVLGQRGYSSTRTTSSPGRDNTTVLLATNARGDKVPPLIIFQGKYLWNEWCYKNDTVKTAYAVSQKGWMETSIFEKYFTNVFLPAIGNERPVLLIYDGHSTHIDLKVIELAISENVTILKLPPHSSHILQPLDVSGMKPMKDRWEEALVKWQRLHIGAKLPKSEFARIITEIWDAINPVILSNGFKKTGIYPLSRQVIPKEKFDPLTWSKWEQYVQASKQGNYGEDDNEAIQEIFEHSIQELVNKPHNNVPTLVKLALKTLNSQPDHKILKYCKASKQTEKKMQNKKNINNYDSEHQDNSIQCDNQNKNIEINQIQRVKREMKTYEKTKEIQKETTLIKCSNKIEITLEKEKQERVTFSKTVDPHKFKLPLPSSNRKHTNLNKVHIFGNELIQAANTTDQINEENFNVSFEELLLNSIARNDPPKNKKKRVTRGAEILTYKEVIERLEKDQEEKRAKKPKKVNIPKKDEQTKLEKQNEKRKKGIKRNTKIKKNHYESDSNSTCSYQSDDLSLSDEDDKMFWENLLTAELTDDLDITNETYKQFSEIASTSMEMPSTSMEMPSTSMEMPSTSTEMPFTSKEKAVTFKSMPLFSEEARVLEVPEEGTFVLAKFSSTRGKKTYKYVCRVQDISDDKIVVTGLKSYKRKNMFRIIKDDISIIDFKDIVTCLPQPERLDRELFKFPYNIDVYEV